MSIEAKGNINSHEDPENTGSTDTAETKATPTEGQLLDQAFPDRKPSLFEKLDTNKKKFLALLAIGGTVATGGVIASEVAKGLGEQKHGGDAEPVATSSATPGQSETTATQPTPEVSPSDLPTSFTSATPEVTPTASSETQSPAGDYNISEAEYQNIVKSFKIDVATHPTAESAIAAFNERMTLFYNGGNTTKDFTKHAEWSHPVDSSVNPGWNSWATQVYTAAAKEALFVPGYAETPNSYLPYMQERKRAVNGLWINSIDEKETPYVMSYEFTPTGIARLANGNFTAYGSSTLTDNANEIPGAKTDSRAIFSKTLDSQAITVVIQDDQWLIHSIETK